MHGSGPKRSTLGRGLVVVSFVVVIAIVTGIVIIVGRNSDPVLPSVPTAR